MLPEGNTEKIFPNKLLKPLKIMKDISSSKGHW